MVPFIYAYFSPSKLWKNGHKAKEETPESILEINDLDCILVTKSRLSV